MPGTKERNLRPIEGREKGTLTSRKEELKKRRT
jgi:hypothetical protein